MVAGYALAGCSPAKKGAVGVTVDAAGRAVVVLAWCPGHPPDHVELTTGPSSKVRNFRLEPRTKLRGTHAEVPLHAPPGDWRWMGAPFGAFTPGEVYKLRSGDSDSAYTFGGSSVTAASLSRLRSGAVLTHASESKTGTQPDTYYSPAEFRKAAEASC
ncbi:hypothetical protein [Actinomadura sp. 9N407]|uniref:hypothetical protein n=1 Tax=Actinomadura sp. 9N407 TaxID=3375154 RepID=UPI003798F9E1